MTFRQRSSYFRHIRKDHKDGDNIIDDKFNNSDRSDYENMNIALITNALPNTMTHNTAHTNNPWESFTKHKGSLHLHSLEEP